MREEKLDRIRYFMMSFAAAFFVLSLLFLFLMTTSSPAAHPPVAEETTAPADEYYPAAEDCLTVLFYGVEFSDSVAGTYLLARFDPVRQGVTVAVLPPATLLGEETLADCYRYGGAIYARDRLSAHLGITIDRYVRMDLSGFIQAAGVIGTVEFELEEELALEEGEMAFTLNAGPQLLDGRKAAAIIRHRQYPGGEAQRSEIITSLACAIIDQRIDVATSVLADKVFSSIINLIDTDISYADYEQRRRAAAWLAEKNSAIAYPLTLEGSDGEDGAFLLYDTTLAQIAGRFV